MPYNSNCLLLNVHHELDDLFILFLIFTSFQGIYYYPHVVDKRNADQNTSFPVSMCLSGDF